MNDYISLYKRILEEYQKFSKCSRLQVAALLVKNGRILCCGYNGTPTGQCNCNELFTNAYRTFKLRKSPLNSWKTVSEEEWRTKHHEFSVENEIHAEQNLFAEIIKNKTDITDATIIISHEPCESCARLIFAAGIKYVMYVNEYDRGSKGIEFLRRNGVSVTKI